MRQQGGGGGGGGGVGVCGMGVGGEGTPSIAFRGVGNVMAPCPRIDATTNGTRAAISKIDLVAPPYKLAPGYLFIRNLFHGCAKLSLRHACISCAAVVLHAAGFIPQNITSVSVHSPPTHRPLLAVHLRRARSAPPDVRALSQRRGSAFPTISPTPPYVNPELRCAQLPDTSG